MHCPNLTFHGVEASFALVSKEWLLILHNLHGLRTLLVIVRHVIDSRAYWIRTHEPSIVGPQQCGDHLHIVHTGIEPKIVVVGIEVSRAEQN